MLCGMLIGRSVGACAIVVLLSLLACKESGDEKKPAAAKNEVHPKGAACTGLKDEKACGDCCSKCCADGPMGMSAGTFSPTTGCACMKRW